MQNLNQANYISIQKEYIRIRLYGNMYAACRIFTRDSTIAL